MKTKTITTTIRILLSLVLCYAIYTETGIWTTLFAILMLVMIEANAKLKNEKFKNSKNNRN